MRRARAISPDSPQVIELINDLTTKAETLYGLATANVLIRDYTTASNDLSRALQLRPNELKYYQLRARAHRGLRLWDRSLEDLKQALVLAQRRAAHRRKRRAAAAAAAVGSGVSGMVSQHSDNNVTATIPLATVGINSGGAGAAATESKNAGSFFMTDMDTSSFAASSLPNAQQEAPSAAAAAPAERDVCYQFF
jgi:tetratricopeptide (TPR) repeat protein